MSAYPFANTFFEELAHADMRHVCVCPGSRSTPLAVAAARQPSLRVWTHLDERSAAFFALGLAKASRAPVAVVCTSGTAAANLLPAVVEAYYARVPLLVLTADRPPELREWGAGQTIDQHGIYGSHVRWFAEAPVPDEPRTAEAAQRHARALACRAMSETKGLPSGPVHLNLPFREPLEPSEEDLEALPAPGGSVRNYTQVRHSPLPPDPEDVARLAQRMGACERGIVVCGPMDSGPDLPDAIADLAIALGWPVVAEPTSQVRCGPHVARTAILAAGDLLLRSGSFPSSHAPDFVLRFGSTPTSKAFRLWLESRPPKDLVLVDPENAWNDPSHLATEHLRCDPVSLCDLLGRRLSPGGEPSRWLRDFLTAERRAQAVLERCLGAEDTFLEPRVVREVADTLPDGALLYVSNSMPIRDLDAFLPASTRNLRVLCNRGANGIDGMVSSALGAAAAGAGPVVLLTGDLALLHDCGALLAARRLGLPLTIVAIDNDGGGIFSFLPIAAFGEEVEFEKLFRTPQGADLGQLVRGFDLPFAQAGSWEHLRTALKEAIAGPGTRVLSVPVNRDHSVRHHREIARAVGETLA